MKNFTLIIGVVMILMVQVSTAQTQLWGTCQNGGSRDSGTIFYCDGNGNNFQLAYTCSQLTGSLPWGNLCKANNGKLYGVTFAGGCNDSCVLFAFDPQTGIFTDIHDLDCDAIQGNSPLNGMILSQNGNLYGLCSQGGANGYGVIYKVDLNTDTYTDIYDFIDSTGSGPQGTLIQLSDGKLYGMTQNGGANSLGVIFSFDTSNSIYSMLCSLNSYTGCNPETNGLIQGTNGKIYGMTTAGGSNWNPNGAIFSFDIYTGIYTELFGFDGTNGAIPTGSLIQATDGKLYGMTSWGRENFLQDGNIFSFDTATNTYTDLFDFNGTNGKRPYKSLIQGSNGLLFGTTHYGGTNDQGVAFSYNITTHIYTKLIDFDGSTLGANPNCDFIEIPSLATGIKTYSNESILNLFPNPATTSITLHSQTPILNSQLIIEDVLGNKIYQQQINNSIQATIDISKWSEGVYFYELRGANDLARGKFIIQK